MKHIIEPWYISEVRGNVTGNKIFLSLKEAGRFKSIGEFEELIHAERALKCVNAFAGIGDPETWMKTNQEHIEGLTKGGAQNTSVAIKLGEDIAKAKEEIKRLESVIVGRNEGLKHYHCEIKELRKENNKLFNREQELRQSFWKRLLFLFKGE